MPAPIKHNPKLTRLSWIGRPKDIAPAFFFTDDKRANNALDIAQALPPEVGIVFRSLEPEELRCTKTKQMAELAESQRRCMFVSQRPELAHQLGATGVHLPEREAYRAKQIRRLFPSLRISTACHSFSVLSSLCRDSIDLIFLSPLFSTKSHPREAGLGVLKFAHWRNVALRRSSRKPLIYALGGINADNIHRLSATGADGYGAIGMFAEAGLE